MLFDCGNTSDRGGGVGPSRLLTIGWPLTTRTWAGGIDQTVDDSGGTQWNGRKRVAR